MSIKAMSGINIVDVYDGEPGEQGVSVTNVITQYRLSDSNSSLTGTGVGYDWSDIRPPVGSNQYLWKRNLTYLSNGTTAISNPVYDSTITNIVFDVNRLSNEITSKVSSDEFHNMITQDETIEGIISDVSETKQTTNGIVSRVSSVESTLTTKADNSTVSTLSSNVSEIAQKANKIELITTSSSDSSSITLTDKAIEAITRQFKVTGADGTTTIIKGGEIDIEELFAQDIAATGTIRGVTLLGTKGEIGGWHIADNCLYVDSPNGDSRIVLQNVGWKILQTTEYSAFTKDENGTRTNCAVTRGTNGYTIIPQADGQLTFFSEFPADPGRYSIVIVSTHDGVPHLSARSTDPEIEGPDWGFEDPSIVVDLEKSHKIWDYYDIVLDGDEAIGPFMFWANIKSVTAGEVIELRVTITKDGETYESGDGDNVSSGVPNNYVLSRKIEEAGKITFPFHINYDGLIYTEKDIYEHGEKLSERYMLKSETFEELNLQGISNSELEEILKL